MAENSLSRSCQFGKATALWQAGLVAVVSPLTSVLLICDDEPALRGAAGEVVGIEGGVISPGLVKRHQSRPRCRAGGDHAIDDG